jgi:saccharopine dehydrogenase-like NADP-dependent oxidoreductase
MKRVLVLGAGLVAKPLVHYLLDKGHEVTVASRTVAKAAALVAGHPNGKALELDVQDEKKLAGLIRECDVAVSLFPPQFHPVVARHCIAARKNMVTTSYVSPAMQELDGPAKSAGVTVLNEIGVDPGLDHMSAMRIIDAARKKGGQIVSFRSYCGGLPAPEANDNPFGYKFSWAPRGVLMASRNGAQYLQDGRRVEIAPERLFRDMHLRYVEDVGDFEAYPNRDSISYIDIYGLQGIKTMYRGTFRNMGWCDTMYNFRRLGLLELEEREVQGETYAGFVGDLVGAGPEDDLGQAVARKLGIPVDSLPVRNLQWLGMFGTRRIEGERMSPLDVLGTRMFEKLAFKPGERDLLVLFHDFEVAYPDGRREHTTSTMVDYGIEGGDSSMSRTVSLPAAIGVQLILTGKLRTPGVLRPVTEDVYQPVLDELATMNIECKEKTETY